MLKIRIATVFLLTAVLVGGCTWVRKATYPPEFVYLEPSEIKSTMHSMSRHIGEIGRIMGDDGSPGQAEAIVKALEALARATDRLGEGAVPTNHLILDQNIEQFRAQVDRALRHAKAQPPSYFETGQLLGACNACHEIRDSAL